MNVWNKYVGKKVFLRTKHGRVYDGIVDSVSDLGDGVIFFTIKNSMDKFATIITTDIVELKEEL